MLSFKDFTPVQYTGGESEQQDYNAYKRKKRSSYSGMDEENEDMSVGRERELAVIKTLHNLGAADREKKRNRLKKKPMVKVSVTKPVGYRIADIGAGGVEHNVKTGTM